MDQRRSKHHDIRSLERDTEKLKCLILTESIYVLLSQIIHDVKDHPSISEKVTEKIIQFGLDRFDDRYNSELLDLVNSKLPPRPPSRQTVLKHREGILSPCSSSAEGGARRKVHNVSFPELNCEITRGDGARTVRNWETRRRLDQETNQDPEEEYTSPSTTYW